MAGTRVDLRTKEGRKRRPELVRRACEMRQRGMLMEEIGDELGIAPATVSALIWDGAGMGAITMTREVARQAAKKALATKGSRPVVPSDLCKMMLRDLDPDWHRKPEDMGLASVVVFVTFMEHGMFPVDYCRGFDRSTLRNAHIALVDNEYMKEVDDRWVGVVEEDAEDNLDIWLALLAATCSGEIQRIIQT